MTDYRASRDASEPLVPQNPLRGTDRHNILGATRLASRYGLPILYPQRAPTGVQTVEQELVSYVTASCCPRGADPLSFWAVCFHFYHFGQPDSTMHIYNFRLELKKHISDCLSNCYGLPSNSSIGRAL